MGYSFEVLLIQALTVYGITHYLTGDRTPIARLAAKTFLANARYMMLLVAFVAVSLVDLFLGTGLRETIYRLFAISALNVIIEAALVNRLWKMH